MRLVVALLLFCSCLGTAQPSVSVRNGKIIHGVSFVGTSRPAVASDMSYLDSIGANFISLMPYAYTRKDEAHLNWNKIGWQWWGETYDGVDSCISMASAHGVQSMIKPHVWLDHGTYTGTFELHSEADWQSFENDYTEFILAFAALSEKHALEIFCIGTEFDKWVEVRPAFWKQLIREVRKVYSGKLTYASNWDATDRLGFWEDLDLIGVDAYYPLCDKRTPDEESLRAGWKPFLEKLEKLSLAAAKPVLFTEWGYQCQDYCAREPWNYDVQEQKNEAAQALCYRVLMEECTKKTWYAGGFVWKWFPGDGSSSRHHSDYFSPQGKLAEKELIKWFTKQ